MTHAIDDVRILEISELTPPSHLLREFICSNKVEELVAQTRSAIHKILTGEDNRLLVVVGPCSIHDPVAALEYGRNLVRVREELKDSLEIVMRVYFEKPRTTIGWKGLINDPDLDGTFKINKGLKVARALLLELNELGLPAACEFLDMITPQYFADLVAWGAIGARTTESQVHRELASGLSCSVGFKNGTDGNVQIAVDAIQAAKHPHHFLSVTKGGHSAIVATKGNEDCHLVLRGGREPGYDRASISDACEALEKAGLRPHVMVDASHANSGKVARNQIGVVHSLIKQIREGAPVTGVMIESHLNEGRQNLVNNQPLRYGVSITDECLGWDDTVSLLRDLASR